jgi:cysteinyl-tRNA synthetase
VPPVGGRLRRPSDIHADQSLRTGVVNVADTIRRLGYAFGLFQRKEEYEAVKLTPEQEVEFTRYKEARKRKNFNVSDPIRKNFEKQDLIIEDTGQNSVVRRKR